MIQKVNELIREKQETAQKKMQEFAEELREDEYAPRQVQFGFTGFHSTCPSCGYCPYCGRGGYVNPWRGPYDPYRPWCVTNRHYTVCGESNND